MVTILTPTYNRGDLLETLYISLKKQKQYNFEWIIVDDGSEDNTENIINEIKKKEKNFKIKYIKTLNGGKHRAINVGINESVFEYTFIVDSDDYLLENAVSRIYYWINTIKDIESFAGVAGLKADLNKERVGSYPTGIEEGHYIDCTNLERKKYKLGGDKAEVYKTNMLKSYPFPEFSGENFLTEASVWNAIAAAGYKIRWFNEIIYICDYRTDGLTNLGIQKDINNFNGFVYYTRLRLRTEKKIFSMIPLVNFSRVAKNNKLSIKEMADLLDTNILKMFIASVGEFIYSKINYSKNKK